MSGTAARYVARTDRVFTQACIDGGDERTRCGEALRQAGHGLAWSLWVPVVLQAGDRACARCAWELLDDAKRAAALERDRREADAENAQGHQEALL